MPSELAAVEGRAASAAPILVTGTHRSGTTWVGRMLASAPSVEYIHEPFHIRHDPAVCSATFDRWFPYICEENEAPYCEPIGKMLADASSRARGTPSASRPQRPLVKDPLAVFSAAWLATRFETRNVVMIRHPAAFAGSLKARGWMHPFSHFLDQPLLMRDHLSAFAGPIMRLARTEHDIVDQAALLWNAIHSVILDYRRRFPAWIYVRHEDVSRQPVDEFRAIFSTLDLEWSDETRRTIEAHSFAAGADDTRAHPDLLKRESRSNVDSWRTRLTVDEIARLRDQVAGVSQHFYSEAEW